MEKTGSAIYEANRIAAAKAKRAALKSPAPRTNTVDAQALPTCPRCLRIFRARIGRVGHIRTFRLYDETKLLPSRFLFQVQQRTKLLRRQRLSFQQHLNGSLSSAEGPAKPPRAPHAAIEDLAEYQQFIDAQAVTRRRIGLAQMRADCDSAENDFRPPALLQPTGNGHDTKAQRPMEPVSRPAPDMSVYQNYFWKPATAAGASNGVQKLQPPPFSQSAADFKGGPPYSRNPQDFLKAGGRSIKGSDGQQQQQQQRDQATSGNRRAGLPGKTLASHRQMPASKAARSATLASEVCKPHGLSCLLADRTAERRISFKTTVGAGVSETNLLVIAFASQEYIGSLDC
ncbi:unnamed protein product [Schistocephalus solidus]|uniref:C2H2-type domain-containing protein n=1 Tax=Schistocephalus solidus TaxID=70667 RepID=A0A183SKB5_SCHSO|nr:unnamed protein product [Schistocephalus solidus]